MNPFDIFGSVEMDLEIERALRNKEPNLDLHKSDAKILKICIMDFRNYIRFVEKNSSIPKNKNDNSFSITIEMDLNGKFNVVSSTENKRKDKIKLAKDWVDWWWKKYKERVGIYIGNTKLDGRAAIAGRHMQNFTSEEKNSIMDMMIETFIKCGEICFAPVLAESLFKKVLGMFSRDFEWTVEQKLNLASDLTSRVRQLCRKEGILLFLTVDRKYYNLRERA